MYAAEDPGVDLSAVQLLHWAVVVRESPPGATTLPTR